MLLKHHTLTGAILLALIHPALAAAADLPQGAQALFGASIEVSRETNAKQMSVKTESNSTNNVVIKWDSFNIAENNIVYFDSFNYLNLVTGSSSSDISGRLLSKGNVFIVNPHGITVSPTAVIDVGGTFGVSTAILDDDEVRGFWSSASAAVLANSGYGMGKVRLLGQITADNLYVDGSQIIIRDADALTSDTGAALSGTQVQLASSTGRVDIGAATPNDTDYSTLYTYLERDAGYEVVNHSAAAAISTAAEFLAMEDDSEYWLTTDLDLGTLTGPALAEINGLTLDGAYNTVTYDLTVNSDSAEGSFGLFGTISDSFISNLKIDAATIHVVRTASDTRIGGLAGTLDNTDLSNVEIADLSLNASDEALASGFEFGGVAGYSKGSDLLNLTATLLEDCEQTLVDANLTFGTLFYDVASNTYGDGVIVGHSSTGEVAAVATGSNTFTAYSDAATAITDYQESYADFDSYFITSVAGDELRQKGFLIPYFVTSISKVYDGEPLSYASQLQDTATDDTGSTTKLKVDGENDEEAGLPTIAYAATDLLEVSGTLEYTEAGDHNISLLALDDNMYFVNLTDGTANTDSNAYVRISKVTLSEIVVSDVTLSSGGDAIEYSIANEDSLNLAEGDSFADLLADGLYFETYEEDGQTYITISGETTNYTLGEVTAGVLSISSAAGNTAAEVTTPATTTSTTPTASSSATSVTISTPTADTTTVAATASAAEATAASSLLSDSTTTSSTGSTSEVSVSATGSSNGTTTFAIGDYGGLRLDNENSCSFCKAAPLSEPRRTPAQLDVESADGSFSVANSTLDDDDDELLS